AGRLPRLRLHRIACVRAPQVQLSPCVAAQGGDARRGNGFSHSPTGIGAGPERRSELPQYSLSSTLYVEWQGSRRSLVLPIVQVVRSALRRNGADCAEIPRPLAPAG